MAEHLVAEGLHYHVAGRTVVDDVSLTLTRGELMALIGPNGAGKPALLHLLADFLKPATGRYVLADKPLEERPTQMLSRHRAVMYQQTQLGFDWPVEAVIAMGHAPWTQRPGPGLIAQVMEMTGCTSPAGRQYAMLSGGGQQRIQLARALAQLWYSGAPRGQLFPDEPAPALGLYHQQHLLCMLETLTASDELHACIVLRDLNLAALWADRIVLPHSGRLVSQRTPETVLQADDLKR